MAYKIKKLTRCTKPHLIIDAGPGSGKTTTMVAGLNLMAGKKPSWYNDATDEQKAIWEAMSGDYRKIGFQAFNASISAELQAKVPAGVDAKTFHKHGNSILRSNGYKTKPSSDCVRYMVMDMLGYSKGQSMTRADYSLTFDVAKLVSLLKNNLLPAETAIIDRLAMDNGVDFSCTTSKMVDMCGQCLERSRSIQPGEFRYIDFDDMLWLPIVLQLDFTDSMYDLLICDEAQDLNSIQHEMVMLSGKRLICVGDKRQAIYGFRGADAKSLDTMKELLEQTDRGVQVLPLQTSFRLPKSGVQNVNSFAPDLKATDDAIEGFIIEQYTDEATPEPGDLVVSRVNGNIFRMAFQLLRKDIPVRIEGKEYGNHLKRIITKNCTGADSIEEAMVAIKAYDDAERERLSKRTFAEELLDQHSEKVACLHHLAEGCKTVQEMTDVIDQLFGSELKREQVVLLSTVHKAKGLEAKRVFFLEPSLVPHPMAKLPQQRSQEYNLKFVAETRHMETLVYLNSRQDEDESIEEQMLKDELDSLC